MKASRFRWQHGTAHVLPDADRELLAFVEAFPLVAPYEKDPGDGIPVTQCWVSSVQGDAPTKEDVQIRREEEPGKLIVWTIQADPYHIFQRYLQTDGLLKEACFKHYFEEIRRSIREEGRFFLYPALERRMDERRQHAPDPARVLLARDELPHHYRPLFRQLTPPEGIEQIVQWLRRDLCDFSTPLPEADVKF